jgi:hypothetical protein
MNSLLTNIAGQFAKPLVLSALLPVLLAASLFLLVTYPLFPLTLPAAIKGLDASWQLTWSVLFALAAAIVLYVLNRPIIRFLSGYSWKDSRLGRPLAEYRRWEYRRLLRRRDGLLELRRRAAADHAAQPEQPAHRERAEALRGRLFEALGPFAVRLNEEFPYGESLVMPTRLGNVIRNFEDYSRQRYGISAVPLWPRLLGVLDPRYAAVIDEAKMAVDFLVNCLVLFILAAMSTLALAVERDADGRLLAAAGLRATLFVILAGLAYAAAVERAQAWGAHVKAAIDLYRGPLLKALGYQHALATVGDERERIWAVLASEWRYPDMCDAMDSVPFIAPAALPIRPTSVRAPNTDALSVVRGVGPPQGRPFATTDVTLRVQNMGSNEASALMIVDAVPANWSFVWASAAASAGVLTVKGADPIVLELSSLAAGASCDLTYRLQSLVAT